MKDISMTYRERRKFRNIINEYKERNYKIYADYGSYDKPWKINGYMPDIIAEKNNKKIIIEIISSNNIKKFKNKLNFLSNFAKENNEYEIQIIFTNPRILLSEKDKIKIYEKALNDIYKTFIDIIRDNINQQKYEYAMILTRNLVENMLKLYATKYKIEIKDKDATLINISNIIYKQNLLSKNNKYVINKLIQDCNKISHNKTINKNNLSDYTSFLLELKNNLL